MATFRLTNINLQVSQPMFNYNTRKALKVEVIQPTNISHQLLKLKNIAEVIDPSTLHWHEQLILPAKFSKNYQFQIYSKKSPKFSYNPEDTQPVIEGCILIHKGDGDYLGWQVFIADKPVGHLFANIEFYNKLGAKKELVQIQNNSNFFGNTINVKKDNLAITSIYANFPRLSTLDKIRVYIEFDLGGAIIRSAIKRLQHNQYRSYETAQIPHNNPSITKLTVTAATFDTHLNTRVTLGQGSTNLILPQQQQQDKDNPLSQRVKIQRIFLYDDCSEEVGWVSFKYLKAKGEYLDPRFFLQDKFNTIGDINFRPLKNTSMTISQVTTPSLMSPLEANSRIYIPKSLRFDDPAKRKACERIGMAHQSVDLKEHPTTQTYKVASFGFGSKIIPVERDHDVPGVGRYQLPLLFDKFK